MRDPSGKYHHSPRGTLQDNYILYADVDKWVDVELALAAQGVAFLEMINSADPEYRETLKMICGMLLYVSKYSKTAHQRLRVTHLMDRVARMHGE